MPSFSIPLEKRAGGRLRPVVPVAIADASTFAPVPKSKQQAFDFRGRLVRGLVDTGAEITCITPELAKELRLPVQGTRPMASASERKVERNIYRIAVIIMAQGKTEVSAAHQAQNVATPISAPSIVEASEFTNLGEGDVEVLIGMDIIKLSVLTITGHDQRLTMSF